ncbi:hypothetical protein B0J18DRAFT_416542 [Chaetomium sp. MPI-SDFR-AT-0129]|nr:hypothetical protein B0J18DRAFT_416542 [Chaetomium sp. MPI-SDFR-AT-0129]
MRSQLQEPLEYRTGDKIWRRCFPTPTVSTPSVSRISEIQIFDWWMHAAPSLAARAARRSIARLEKSQLSGGSAACHFPWTGQPHSEPGAARLWASGSQEKMKESLGWFWIWAVWGPGKQQVFNKRIWAKRMGKKYGVFDNSSIPLPFAVSTADASAGGFSPGPRRGKNRFLNFRECRELPIHALGDQVRRPRWPAFSWSTS